MRRRGRKAQLGVAPIFGTDLTLTIATFLEKIDRRPLPRSICLPSHCRYSYTFDSSYPHQKASAHCGGDGSTTRGSTFNFKRSIQSRIHQLTHRNAIHIIEGRTPMLTRITQQRSLPLRVRIFAPPCNKVLHPANQIRSCTTMLARCTFSHCPWPTFSQHIEVMLSFVALRPALSSCNVCYVG